jgi:rubrerythrin
MDMETRATEIYGKATCNLRNSEVKGIILSFAAVSKKRKAMLERLYKENMYSDMDTGIFEPIAGLDSTDYTLESKPGGEVDVSDIPRLAINTEDKIVRFYHDLAAQLKSRRSGIAKGLLRAVEENSGGRIKLDLFKTKINSSC